MSAVDSVDLKPTKDNITIFIALKSSDGDLFTLGPFKCDKHSAKCVTKKKCIFSQNEFMGGLFEILLDNLFKKKDTEPTKNHVQLCQIGLYAYYHL